jgi:hypothetical protein
MAETYLLILTESCASPAMKLAMALLGSLSRSRPWQKVSSSLPAEDASHDSCRRLTIKAAALLAKPTQQI